MIYAVRSSSPRFIKFGVSDNPAQRLMELQVGCPLELQIIALADWPNESERQIHAFLLETRVRGEWFEESLPAWLVLQFMYDMENGHSRFLAEFKAHVEKLTAIHEANKLTRQDIIRRLRVEAIGMGFEPTAYSRARIDGELAD